MTLAPDSDPDIAAAARLYALVPSAGVGERSGAIGPKQYQMLGARSVLGHTLAALERVARLSEVLVVVGPTDREFAPHIAGISGDRAAVAPCGGATRAQTVRNGLDALLARGARRSDWVLVHDAARCLVRPEWIDALIDACIGDPVGGLLALPVADTLKTEHDGRVETTLDRRGKWQAQTPQMFRIGMLIDALDHAGPNVTDEASAIEATGLAPRLVAASLENFKVTYPADFELAARLLKARA